MSYFSFIFFPCAHPCVLYCNQRTLFPQLVGEKQSELQVNSMQLLYYQAPLSAFLLLFVIPFFEPLDAFHGVFFNWPYEALVIRRTNVEKEFN